MEERAQPRKGQAPIVQAEMREQDYDADPDADGERERADPGVDPAHNREVQIQDNRGEKKGHGAIDDAAENKKGDRDEDEEKMKQNDDDVYGSRESEAKYHEKGRGGEDAALKAKYVELMHEVAETMQRQKLTVHKLFGPAITKKIAEGEEHEVISVEDFVSGLERLQIPNMSNEDLEILVDKLRDEDNDISIEMLLQEIEESMIASLKATLKPPYQALDDLSMALLFALTEHIVNNNIQMYDLFQDIIYTQRIHASAKASEGEPEGESKMELIKSDKFFETLCNIGIKPDPSPHEELQSFLALSDKHQDKLRVDKLISAITQFAKNSTLRYIAERCCQRTGIHLTANSPPAQEEFASEPEPRHNDNDNDNENENDGHVRKCSNDHA